MGFVFGGELSKLNTSTTVAVYVTLCLIFIIVAVFIYMPMGLFEKMTGKAVPKFANPKTNIMDENSCSMVASALDDIPEELPPVPMEYSQF